MTMRAASASPRRPGRPRILRAATLSAAAARLLGAAVLFGLGGAQGFADTIPGTRVGPGTIFQSQPSADFSAPRIPVIKVQPPKVNLPRLPDFPDFCTDPSAPGCGGRAGVPRQPNPCPKGPADAACR